MKKVALLAMTIVIVGVLTGCGHQVDVPPAHIGKLSTASGLKEDVIRPSKLRLSNMCLTCDSLILVEASDFPIEEKIEVFMPNDQLNLAVDVRGTASIASDQKVADQIFSRVTADATSDTRVMKIPFEKVYKVYGEPILREVVRSVLTKYSIEEVMMNRDRISQELLSEVQKRWKTSPLTVLQLGLADIQPPKVIVAAQEARKEREVEILKAEAEKQVSLKKAEAALEVAIKQQEVDLTEAETQVLVDQTLSKGVSAAFIAQRSLKVLETLAESENKVFFMPMEAMSNPSLMLGSVAEGFKLKPNIVDDKPVVPKAATTPENQVVEEAKPSS